jgi:hypothetical protein
MYMIPENSRVSNFVVQPGGQVTYQGTPPSQFKLPEPNPNSVQNVLAVLEKSVEDATISAYATGQTSSSTDKTKGTATGIIRLQQAAGDMISFMRSNFQQTINQIGTMWLSNNQQYLDRPITVPGEKGVTEEVHPAMIQGDMELRIDDASMEPVSKEDQRAAYMQYVQQALALQQASFAQQQATQGKTEPLYVDFKELFEQMSEKFGIKSEQSIVLEPEDMQQQPQMPGQPMMPEQPEMPPQGPEMPSEQPPISPQAVLGGQYE